MATVGDSSAVDGLLNDLSANIDGVEIALRPLLQEALSKTTSKLPLLDKAKLYVHTAYAIESIVFSYLRLHNVDAKSHPVFQELARTRNYFQKVHNAEAAGPQAKLDKAAAGRFIKHALAGNEEYDRKRAEVKRQQEIGAKRKFDELEDRYKSANRFSSATKKIKSVLNGPGDASDHSDSRDAAISANAVQSGSTVAVPPSTESSGEVEEVQTSTASKKKKKKDKGANTSKEIVTSSSIGANAGADAEPGEDEGKERKKKKKSSKAPKDAHETFRELVGKEHGQGKEHRSKRKTRDS